MHNQTVGLRSQPAPLDDDDRAVMENETRRLADAELLANGPKPTPKAAQHVTPATFSPPELLAGPSCPLTGRPLDEPATQCELPWRKDARDKRNMARFQVWSALSAQSKTQLVADLKWGKENAPVWRVSMPDDPAQPEILLRASDTHLAQARYISLCGLRMTGLNAGIGHEIVVSPYVPEVLS